MTIKLNLDDFKKEISLTKKKDENLIDLKDFEYISYTNNNEVDDIDFENIQGAQLDLN